MLFTEETKSLREVLDILTYPEKVDDQYITKILVDFFCRCSKERFAEKIVALGHKGTHHQFHSFSLAEKPQNRLQRSYKVGLLVIVWDVFLTIKASFEFFLHRIGSTGKRN